ncbi:hypothetical protein I4U23_000544 [Adineta vaga]|nr:hypothetical protein I4U23_000544 [Adineta vaga]
MAQTAYYEDYYSQHYENQTQPGTIIIVYDPPNNPNEYLTQYMDSLLDSSALINWCKRLGIPEYVIALPTMMGYE